MVTVSVHSKNGKWNIENLTGKGPYQRRALSLPSVLFRGHWGLKESIGWDTVDELLAQYHGWKVVTDEKPAGKHLKPRKYLLQIFKVQTGRSL